ncbi:MAG: hypothetical protein V7K24_15500 [Nostoc sp.]
MEQAEKYCRARLAGWNENDMSRWSELQKQLLIEKEISSELLVKVYERTEAIHKLAEIHFCAEL